MSDRVAVFIDYENVHRTGHSLYTTYGTPLYRTVVDPVKIAERIVTRRRFASSLVDVHVFRGRPLPQFQPEARSANDQLANAWEADGAHVVRRDLKYVIAADGTWRAEEKGIDVALAIGAIESAMDGEFDVAILFSNDTDQLPTLELMFNKLSPKVEIACWTGAKPLWFPDMLRANPSRKLPYCHFLSEADFVDCHDNRVVLT